MNKFKFKKRFFILLSLCALFALATYAGSLTPSAPPAATSYTLQDIYLRLTTNQTAAESNHAFSPSSTPAGSMYTLTDIYNTIPTINSEKVTTGTSYLGVEGVIFKNLFNGTGGGIQGGSQANGGIDDRNEGNPPPSDRYATSWTQCVSGNSYCGTGLSSSDAKDEATGIIWSKPCNGVGCAAFTEDVTPSLYTWNSSGANNNSKTASQLCSSGAHGEAGWLLPHQRQLMQAYINGSYGNLVPETTQNENHWASTLSDGTGSWAGMVHLSEGTSDAVSVDFWSRVRCVR